MARTLLLIAIVLLSQLAFSFDAKQAHVLIQQQKPELLGDGRQLVSLYYFGSSDTTSVVGLERVGDDYLPIRWLLIFNGQTLLGWYFPAHEFPAKFNAGFLKFPQGVRVQDVYLWPEPPGSIMIGKKQVPFYGVQKSID